MKSRCRLMLVPAGVQSFNCIGGMRLSTTIFTSPEDFKLLIRVSWTKSRETGFALLMGAANLKGRFWSPASCEPVHPTDNMLEIKSSSACNTHASTPLSHGYGLLYVSHGCSRYLGTDRAGRIIPRARRRLYRETAGDHCLNGHLLMFQLLRILVPYHLSLCDSQVFVGLTSIQLARRSSLDLRTPLASRVLVLAFFWLLIAAAGDGGWGRQSELGRPKTLGSYVMPRKPNQT